MEQGQSKLEQLNIRLANLRVVIQVTEFEIAEILQEIYDIENPHKIGFIISSSNEQNKKRPNKRPPSNS